MNKLLLLGLAGLAPMACGASKSNAPADGGGPSIAIVSPVSGDAISIATSTDVPVVFEVTSFALRAAGTCDGVNDTCGHVHVFVDGTGCNGGQIYNNAFPTAGSSPSPAMAIAELARCPAAAGAHTITLELHRDDHSPVSNAAAATVDITAG